MTDPKFAPDGGSYLFDPDTGELTQVEPTTAPPIRKSERATLAADTDTTEPATTTATRRTRARPE